jgi:Kef-type K+ transport system membrane component KefB
MFFVPVFFANIGISTKFTGITPAVVLFGFLFIIAGMLGKLLGCGGAALACGYTPSDSVKIGFGMMARAEVALVCAQKGIDAGLIDSSIMPFILILILVTSFVTPIGILKSYKHDYMKFSHDLCDE